MNDTIAELDLTRLFNPRSAALVGATDHPTNFGGRVFQQMTGFGYPGKIYPVNPRLTEIGAPLMVGTLTELEVLHALPQDDAHATYAKKIDKAESRIDWSLPAEQIERQVRAFAPAPGAWFEFEGERYRVLKAEVVPAEGDPRLRGGSAENEVRPREGGDLPRCSTVLDDKLTIATGEGAIRPLTVQRAGKPAMDTAALLRGKSIAAGTVLG